jgi:hypothetical protein
MPGVHVQAGTPLAQLEKEMVCTPSQFAGILQKVLIMDDFYFYLYATTLTIYFYICYFWLFYIPEEERRSSWWEKRAKETCNHKV